MICLKGVGYCGFFGGCGLSKLAIWRFSTKIDGENLIKNKLILIPRRKRKSCSGRHFVGFYAAVQDSCK